jgi:hypothetical protein
MCDNTDGKHTNTGVDVHCFIFDCWRVNMLGCERDRKQQERWWPQATLKHYWTFYEELQTTI